MIVGNMCQIYLVGEDLFNGPTRIGVSINPISRLKILQTGNPNTLHILATAEINIVKPDTRFDLLDRLDDVNKMRHVETDLLRSFDKKRGYTSRKGITYQRDWCDVSAIDIVKSKNYIRTEYSEEYFLAWNINNDFLESRGY